MGNKQIVLFKVAMSESISSPLLEVIHSGWIGQGGKVTEFEKALSEKFHNKNCLTLSAGTHGLSLGLKMLGVGPGDEVITTPLTCTASNMPILSRRANIVWADIKEDINIQPESIKSLITNKTKAILFVHWGGYPADLEEIYNIAVNNGISVIEDAAHCFGTVYKDSIIGDCQYSNFCMISFQAIKHLTCMDGGVLFTRNGGFYKRGKLLRWYGIDRENPRTDFRCEENIKEFGDKWHMNDVCATIGLANMKLAESNVELSRDNARYYDEELSDVNGIELTQVSPHKLSSYWLYTFLVEKRSDFCTMMATRGISVSRVHERNDKHTCFGEFRRELPMLEYVVQRYISIPVGWWVTKEDREYIVESIKEGW